MLLCLEIAKKYSKHNTKKTLIQFSKRNFQETKLQIYFLLQSNQSQRFYTLLGSTPLVDFTFIFVLSPLAFICLSVNTFVFIILLRSQVHFVDLLNKFLLLYLFNNLMICLLVSFTFASMSPR